MAPEPSILMVRSFMMVQDQMSNDSHESSFFYPEFMEMMAGQRDREQFWPIFEIFGKYLEIFDIFGKCLKYLGDI